MLTKSAPFEFKSLDDAGTFEALVAVFGNVDKGGDRIMPGAFKNTLRAWAKSGDPIPVIFNHDWADANAHVGVVEEAKETDQGLWVRGRLDVEDNPVAKQVHRLMQRRSLKEFSFGYSIPAGGERRAKDGVNDLLQIDLAEVGPTLKGMNPATELHAVKSALGVEDAPTVEELREKAAQVAREVEEAAIPEVPEQPQASKEPEIDLVKELQEIKAQLATVRTELEDLRRSKADVADKEHKTARSADPLRQQAEATALEVASGGIDLPTPPTPHAGRQPEIPLRELKQRTREEMLGVLSGGMTE